jgi:pyruvate dehydrogenase E2 component (dihydrolipoamide acetyltransferase)
LQIPPFWAIFLFCNFFFGDIMAQEVRLPQLGKAMKQATVVSLKTGLNHSVAVGQILCELETDKATLELESPLAGKVRHIFCRTNQNLPVGAPLFIIGQEDETLSPEFINTLKSEFDACLNSEITENAAGKINAGEHHANDDILSKIRPATGPLNTLQDLPAEAHRTAVETIEPGRKIPLSRWQRIIADKMIQSKRQIPCFYLNIRADVTELSELREKLNKTAQEKIAFNDFLMVALAKGMKHYPVMTGQLGHDCIILAATIDIGLAVSTDNGLVAPVVRDIGSKTLSQVAAASHDLIARTKENKLNADDLAGGCITISNLGGLGIDSFIPIAIPGQCSILGVGRITETPTPSGKGDILIRKIMNLNLSVDHRVANGADAAQFLDFIKKLLEHPEELAVS